MSDITSSYRILKKQYYQLQLKENAPVENIPQKAEIQPNDHHKKKQQHALEEASHSQDHEVANPSNLIEQLLSKLDELSDVQINNIKVSENPADDIKCIKDLVSSYFWSGYYLGQQSIMEGNEQSDDDNDNDINTNNTNHFVDTKGHNDRFNQSNTNNPSENINPDTLPFDSSSNYDY